MKVFPKLKIGLIFALAISVFFVLNLFGFSGKIKNSFYFLSSSFQENLWEAGDKASDFLVGIFKSRELKEKVDELELKIVQLESQTVSLVELKEENESLRSALNIGLGKEFQLEDVEIIGKDISQDILLLNKGEKDGILEEGIPVITPENVLVGRIGKIYEDFSEVILITNQNSSFDAKVFEKDIYGIVKGKGGSELLFDLVPKEEELASGELIITAQLGGIFPKGLLVGEIKEIKKSDIESFQQAEVRPFFDIKELRTLFLIKGF